VAGDVGMRWYPESAAKLEEADERDKLVRLEWYPDFVVVSALCADLVEPQARRYTKS
jgi:hypothetical protein